MTQWNPRYVLFAKQRGNTPDEQLKEDKECLPGGSMRDFMKWVRDKWFEWDQMKGHERNHPHCEEDHKEFDIWLDKDVAEAVNNENKQEAS